MFAVVGYLSDKTSDVSFIVRQTYVFSFKKWLRIRLAWHNSNKRVSLSFKWRGSRGVAVMRYSCYANGFQFDS